jgi:hypothetical protein
MNSLQVSLEVLDKSTKVLNDVGKSFNGMQNKIEKFANVAKNIFVGGAIVNQMIGMTNAAMAMGEEIADTAAKTGLTAAEVQKIGYVAEMSGTSIDALQKGIKNLGVAGYDAAQGSKTASEGFKRLGISVTDSSGALKSSGALFQEAVLRLSEIKNTSERAAVAQQLFGKASIEVLAMTAKGSENIKRLYEDTERYGMLLSEETVERLDNTKDALDRLNRVGKIASANITMVWIPAVTFWTSAIAGNMAAWDELVAKRNFDKMKTDALDDLNKKIKHYSEVVIALEKHDPFKELDGAKKQLDVLNQQLAAREKADKIIKAAETKEKSGSGIVDIVDKDKNKKTKAPAEKFDGMQEALKELAEQRKIRDAEKEKEFQIELRQNEEALQRRAEHIKKIDAMESEAAERRKQQKQQEAEVLGALAVQTGIAYGQAIASGIGKGEEGLRESFKGVLTVTLDFIEKQLIAAVFANAATRFMQLGVPGLLLSAGEAAAITIPFEAAKAGIQSFESGGYPRAGAALVGERGPEIVQMSGNERVFNNRDTRQMMQGQSQPVNFHFYDKKGNEISTLSAQIRSGQADSVVADLINSAKRRGLV